MQATYTGIAHLDNQAQHEGYELHSPFPKVQDYIFSWYSNFLHNNIKAVAIRFQLVSLLVCVCV